MKRDSVIMMVGAVVALSLALYLFFIRSPEPVAQGDPIVTVQVPSLSAAERIGEAAFNTNCASCHGTSAAGRDGVAPPLVHRTYEPSHHGDQAFLIAAQFGVRAHHWPFGNMPPVEGVSESEVESIVAYVRALQRANGID